MQRPYGRLIARCLACSAMCGSGKDMSQGVVEESTCIPRQLLFDDGSVPVDSGDVERVREAAQEFVAAQDAAIDFTVGLEHVAEDRREAQLEALAARFERVWASYHDLVTALGYPLPLRA
jgi:hypothetical protein